MVGRTFIQKQKSDLRKKSDGLEILSICGKLKNNFLEGQGPLLSFPRRVRGGVGGNAHTREKRATPLRARRLA